MDPIEYLHRHAAKSMKNKEILKSYIEEPDAENPYYFPKFGADKKYAGSTRALEGSTKHTVSASSSTNARDARRADRIVAQEEARANEEARAVKPGKPGKPAPAKVAPKAGSAKIKTETKAKRDVESDEDSDNEARPLAKSKRKSDFAKIIWGKLFHKQVEELEEDELPVKKTTRSDKLKDKEPEKESEKKVLSAKERARIKMRPCPKPEPMENEPQQIADSEASNQILAKSPSKLKQRTSDSSRRDDAFGYLGRLQRQKVRISRHHILESAVKVLELYGSSSSVLEVEYFEEVGTGLGPTLEFYSLVSKEFARRELKMWRDADSSVEGPYVQRPLGLFPAPEVKPEAKLSKLWAILGQFVGKALLDSRIVDMSFNPLFLKYILNEEIPLTIASLKLVDPALANSLSKLQAYGVAQREIESSASMSPSEKEAALSDLTIHGAHLEDLALDFTVPGYDIELKPGGRDIAVTDSNVEEYVREVIDAVIGRGVQNQVQAFRTGFSKVFAVTDLQSFSSEELDLLFGNAEEDWSTETLTDALKADHGFNVDSSAIRDLISTMGCYDEPTRRAFLQFITGSPKLPIGGFRGLSPQLTVVRKPHEPPLKADDYLPSVMTCVNYLKLPEYSTKSVMEARLKTAMMEGGGSFHLS
ncbi:hypothetical protein RSAG8_03899, partial [Rhizoctonia solani AG-8 WAC10335]